MRSSYSGSVIGPKTSTCTLPRIFMPAPWITRTRGIALSVRIGCETCADGWRPSRRRAFARRDPDERREHRGGVAMQDLLARFLTDLRFRERLGGPLAAEFSAVGAAHDAIGAVQAHRGLDRARAERVAIHRHLRSADACRRQLFFRRVEQRAVIPALDLVRHVATE